MADKALIRGAEDGDIDKVKLLLDSGECSDITKAPTTSTSGRLQETALYWACAMQHVDVVKLLLERGAAVNTNPSPVSYVADYFHEEIFQLLLAQNGVQVNPVNKTAKLLCGEQATAGN